MSAISSKSVNPPVPCEGVTFAYALGGPVAPQLNQLGNLAASIVSGAIVTPISGASQDQIYYTAGVLGTGFPAGSYVAYSVSTLVSLSGLFDSYISVVAASDGTTIITDSAASFIQEQQDPSLPVSTINMWYFTSVLPFMVYSRLRSGSGGGSATPTDNGSLQVVRIA
jgi:hypothetical protein